MFNAQSAPRDIKLLEKKLAGTSKPMDRIRTLDRLISHYVYTQPTRARELLQDLKDAYEATPDQSVGFLYYQHLGNLENQVYADRLALVAMQEAVKSVDREGDIADKIEVYLDYVGILINLGQLEPARDYFELAERFLGSFPSDRLRARALCRHGYLYIHSFSYAKAIPTFLEADRLLSGGSFELVLKDHYFYTLVHYGLGTLLTRPDSEDKAASAFKRAIARCEEKGLYARLPWHQLALGEVLLGKGAHEEAIAGFQSIINSNANGSRRALASAYVNLGLCYYETGEPSEVITQLLDQAEQLFLAEEEPPRQQLVAVEIARAQLQYADGDLPAAINKLQQTFDSLDPHAEDAGLSVMGQIVEISQMLATCYAESGDYPRAYDLQMRYNVYLDRYHELQDAKRQEEFAAQFEAEIREKERESLQLRASQLQLRALRAQMNPHFLYNALNSIQSFITTNDASTASRYLAKFAMLMRRSLEYTNREYITLEDEVSFLKDYLDINCHLRFGGQLSYEVELVGDLEEDVLGVPTMILQPYVENAIEHGLRTRPKGHISVRFEAIDDDDDNIKATVTDDGIGRTRVREMQRSDNTRPYHQSRGTDITRSRLELLTNDPENRVLIEDLHDENGEATGTRVTVRIPVSDVLPRR
ncbi:histidine kinase [Neolewinella lacunae]|uniref:Histidine kinase n=1 Tax=Neolewinella lacunae TaxID=1517758 RepID=A0A923PF00_9BACT|nr:histidine kinase [Neolewinella lacunae]MBC6992903.1 histidine kinase [Neolewinella lacunae]MDN3633733.1 histidine kinase [Neolewinella lacunae]